MRTDLDEPRSQVAAALTRAMSTGEDELRRLLGVKGDALAEAVEANRTVLNSPTTPALDRYTGVLYGAIDHTTLDTRSRSVLDDSVLIASGLWGLVAPLDPIPLYKLKMSASLDPLGRLSGFWRPALRATLGTLGRHRRVWNLLPKEHDAAVGTAWSDDADPTGHYSVSFLQPNTKGDLVAVSHWNKFLKGALVRHLVEEPSTEPVDLLGWDHPSGFTLDEQRSSTTGGRTTLVFVNEERPS